MAWCTVSTCDERKVRWLSCKRTIERRLASSQPFVHAVPGANYAERVRLKKESHRSSVLCVEWNRTATNLLATGSADETVRLWDVSTARCVATYDTLHSDMASVLVTASTDKTVRVWDANALASAGSSSAAERGRGKKAAASAASASSAMLLRVTPKVGAVLSVGTCSDDGRLLVVGGSKGVSVVDLTAAHAEAKAAVSQADNGGSSSSDDDSDSDGDGDGEM